jgi:branched-chain amino acid transport system substrate-binding protein
MPCIVGSRAPVRPDALMAAVESIRNLDIPMLLPGVKMSVSKDDHGPLKAMQMMRFNGTSWEMIGDLISGR